MTNASYQELKEHRSKIADMKGALALLHWDQETYMPKKGASFRAQQIATLSGVTHELATHQNLGRWLKELINDTALPENEARNVELMHKEYERSQKYPVEFITEQSRSISAAYQAWEEAREKNDYSIYEPHLEKLVALKRRETEILGFEDHPYDALLDEFEPGSKTSSVEKLFEEVREHLVPFIKAIGAQKAPDCSFMSRHYPEDKQWDFGLVLLEQMGYDFEAGRQDKSTHPFTINFSPEDVRVTTRVDEHNLDEMIWSCVHEGGHALYEQGIKPEHYGMPSGEYVSLGIHESQSRLWENNVGRSLGYWEVNFPKLQAAFPKQLGDVSLKQFYQAMNNVKPSFVRTSADELTYHSHILIRFEAEKALIEGSLATKDLRDFWNAKYKEYLGLTVTNDKEGILQDIHWSHGSFGYFPTYSIGSFYAAQFYNAATNQISGLEDHIKAGNMKPLLEWLRTNIHQHGKLYTADELCERITGEKLRFGHFMDYAQTKYSALYNLSPVLSQD